MVNITKRFKKTMDPAILDNIVEIKSLVNEKLDTVTSIKQQAVLTFDLGRKLGNDQVVGTDDNSVVFYARMQGHSGQYGYSRFVLGLVGTPTSKVTVLLHDMPHDGWAITRAYLGTQIPLEPFTNFYIQSGDRIFTQWLQAIGFWSCNAYAVNPKEYNLVNPRMGDLYVTPDTSSLSDQFLYPTKGKPESIQTAVRRLMDKAENDLSILEIVKPTDWLDLLEQKRELKFPELRRGAELLVSQL